MLARIVNYNTDFTRFLGEKIRHRVEIVTQEATLECSGVMLSQHSEEMRKLLEKEDKIALSDYKFAKDCLKILHGGSVEFTEENCEDIIKFGIQFGLSDLIGQGLEYLASNTGEENLIKSEQVCVSACRFAESCKLDANVDYFWPLEDTVMMVSDSAIDELVANVHSTAGIKAVLEMIKNKALARRLLSNFIALIDQSNIAEILATFSFYESCDIYAEAFSDCPKTEITSFFTKIEGLELQEEQQKTFQNMKECMVHETETNGLQLKPDKDDLLATWRQFTEEEMLKVCQVFETSFHVVEVLMSWVSLHKPALKTVRQLCSLMDTFELEREYLEHVTQVLRSEGYVVSFDLENCKGKTEANLHTAEHVEGLTLTYGSSCEVISRTLSAKYQKPGWFGHSDYKYTVTIGSDGLVWEGATNGCSKMYGRTVEGRQIPFYTDVRAAIDSGTVYDVSSLRSLQ